MKRKKLFAAAVIFFLFIAGIDAQLIQPGTYTVDGTVVEQMGGMLGDFMHLEGVKVYLQEMLYIAMYGQGPEALADQQKAPIPIDPYMTIDSTETKADGGFIFEDLYSSSYRLVFELDGYTTKYVSFTLAKDSTFWVVMGQQKQVDVGGIVTEDTSPLEILKIIRGATVYLQIRDNGLIAVPMTDQQVIDPIMPPWYTYYTIDSTTSDNMGQYTFSGIGSDYYRLAFMAEGYQTEHIEIYPTEDAVINAELLPEGASAAVTGKVLLTPGGEPVVGCTLTVEPMQIYYIMDQPVLQKQGGFVNQYSAFTNDNGEYIVSNVPITYTNQPVTVYLFNGQQEYIYKSVTLYNNSTITVDFIMSEITSVENGNADWNIFKGGAGSPVSICKNGIVLKLDAPQAVDISAYTVSGRRIEALSLNRSLSAGTHSLRLDLSGVADNMIVLKVKGERFEEIRRVNLIR